MNKLENNVIKKLKNEKILEFKRTRFEKVTEIIKISLKKAQKVLPYAKIPVFIGFFLRDAVFLKTEVLKPKWGLNVLRRFFYVF